MQKNTYFKYLYNSPKNESHRTITKIGGDQHSFKKRKILRFYIDNIFSKKKKISRKELILLPYFCYAISIKKNLSSLKYILINDAISLRSEKIINGFSGCIVEQIILDFPKVKLVSLTRDPRAQYASSRHQSVNEFDNNYNIRIGNLFRIFANLFFE